MEMIKDFVSKFLLELLMVGVCAVGSILWLFHGQIIALESGRQVNKDNISLVREDIDLLRKENREDHKDIMDELRRR